MAQKGNILEELLDKLKTKFETINNKNLQIKLNVYNNSCQTNKVPEIWKEFIKQEETKIAKSIIEHPKQKLEEPKEKILIEKIKRYSSIVKIVVRFIGLFISLTVISQSGAGFINKGNTNEQCWAADGDFRPLQRVKK